MADPFIGEIRVFPINYAPQTWLECNGQVLNTAPYQALYSLIGNTFGGTAPNTFGLPNLNGNAVAGVGQAPGLSNYVWGQTYGATTVTLDYSEMPNHNHSSLLGRAAGPQDETATAAGSVLAQLAAQTAAAGTYVTQPSTLATEDAQMSDAAIAPVGGGQSHNNQQPLLALRFCIATTGEYPLRP